MSTKGDWLDVGDHIEDRLYDDCSDRTINIEIHSKSTCFEYFCEPIENPNYTGLLSIKEDSKMYAALKDYFRKGVK